MGVVVVKNVVKRKPGCLYYSFLTHEFKTVQLMVRETSAKLKWHAVERKRKRND